MVNTVYPVVTTRSIAKTVTSKQIGRPASEHLAGLAKEYVADLIRAVDDYVSQKGKSRITIEDIDYVMKNFKGY